MIWIDFETRSECDLPSRGAYNYALDTSVRKDHEVTTWRQWKWMQEIKRRDKAEGRR